MAKVDPQILAHLEWLGFVRPTGLVVSAPALVRAGAILDRRDAEGQRLFRACVVEREFKQLTLGFAEEEKRELEANMRSWKTRLDQFHKDIETEPKRVRGFYEVRAKRIEPVGVVYLWPESN